jgi:hypothetical protein
MDAQKLILAELTKEFGGAAAAASTPFDKLKVSLGNLAEDMGSYLIPIVDKAATFLMDKALPAAEDLGNAVGSVLGPALHIAGEGLKFIYDVGKGAVDLFKSLPGPLQLTVGALAATAALKGPVGSLFSTVKDLAEGAALKVLYAKDAISGLGGAGGVAKAGLGGLTSFFGGPWGIAIAGATLGLSALVGWLGSTDDATEETKQATQDYTDALRQANGVINDSVRAAAAKAAQDAGILDVAQKVGIALPNVTDAITNQGTALDSTRERLRAYIAQHVVMLDANTRGLDSEGQAAQDALTALDSLVGGGNRTIENQRQLAAATAEAGDSSGSAAVAAQTLEQQLQDTADAASDARQQTDLFKQSLDILTGAHISLAEAQSNMYEALAAATGALDNEHGAVLDATGAIDLHSEAGRKAQDVLFGVRDAGNQYIATLIQQGATLDETTAADADLRKSFIESAGQMGITGQAAEDLADQILGVPDSRLTTFKADTQQATNAANELQRLIDSIHGRTVDIIARATLPDLNGAASGSGRPGLATGGPVFGAGTGTSDSIPAMLSNGEHVLTAREVRAAGGHSAIQAWRKSLVAGFANGGPVGAPISIAAELDNSTVNKQLDAFGAQVIKMYEPVHGYVNALNWAMSQSGKPYIWGGVGPGGYDCSGFMSAITNVIRGRSPYSRVGSTASFPWGGFASGYGLFTIGSTPNAGGGIGHMAGTLLGVNVESTGDHVRYGATARGASNGLFTTRAHLAMANGGVIGEPVSGIGMYSGRSYSFGERGPETVTPGLPGGGGLTIQLDGPATTALLEGVAVTVTADALGVRSDRIAYTS